jgi:CubicO group peptidase (beta-lactamase class C family)
MGPDTMMGKALSVNGAFSGDGTFNLRAVRAAEVPAAAGVGDARSLARMYAACIGEVDGVRLLSESRVRDATTQRTEGPDKVLMGLDLQWGLGFMVPSSILQPGGSRGFGHFGAGGSGAFADPDAGLAFGYAMNKMAMGMAGDTRSADLFAACYEAIG